MLSPLWNEEMKTSYTMADPTEEAYSDLFPYFSNKIRFFTVERNLIYSEKNDAIKTNGVVFCS